MNYLVLSASNTGSGYQGYPLEVSDCGEINSSKNHILIKCETHTYLGTYDEDEEFRFRKEVSWFRNQPHDVLEHLMVKLVVVSQGVEGRCAVGIPLDILNRIFEEV